MGARKIVRRLCGSCDVPYKAFMINNHGPSVQASARFSQSERFVGCKLAWNLQTPLFAREISFWARLVSGFHVDSGEISLSTDWKYQRVLLSDSWLAAFRRSGRPLGARMGNVRLFDILGDQFLDKTIPQMSVCACVCF